MADEAVIVELLGNKGDPVSYACADADAIEKGTVLIISGTAARMTKKAAVLGEPIAGIAAAEKVASDGSTTIACYTNGIFDMKTASGANRISGGNIVISSGANTISDVRLAGNPTMQYSGASILGISLENGPVAGTSDTITVKVRL